MDADPRLDHAIDLGLPVDYGSGGGTSANWASNLVIPRNAVTGTAENPGVSWSVSFACEF